MPTKATTVSAFAHRSPARAPCPSLHPCSSADRALPARRRGFAGVSRHTNHPLTYFVFSFNYPPAVQLGRLALEWNALTEARDKHIRDQFTQEQKLLRAEKILALRTMLEDLCDEVSLDAERDKGFTACTGVATTVPVALRPLSTARAGAMG